MKPGLNSSTADVRPYFGMGRRIKSLFFISAISSAFLLADNLQAVPIGFEELGDLTPVGSFYPNVTFGNATVITAGISLNEIELPPSSGQNVAFDDGGAITGTFSAPVYSLQFNITYMAPITLTIFDSGGNLLGSAFSNFSDNTVSSGRPPNELMLINSPLGITSFQIEGAVGGGSFVIDDFDSKSIPSVPDQKVPLWFICGLILGLGFVQKKLNRPLVHL